MKIWSIIQIVFLAGLIIWFACASDDPVTSKVPTDISEVPRVTPETLKSRLDNGDTVMVVDVRSQEEYDESHIPGAINIPFAETNARLGEFPSDQDIVFY